MPADPPRLGAGWEVDHLRKLMAAAALGILAAVGAYVLLHSPALGAVAANNWLRSIGGSTDATQFQTMLEAYAAAYRLFGAILLGGGMFGFFHEVRDRVG